jgi:MFS family permease
MQQWLNWSGALPFRQGRFGSWQMLRQTRFSAYFAGSLISNLGTWLQNTAQMLLAYRFTHSAFAVGTITCVQFSGFLVIGPWAGGIADRLGARRVLVCAQMLSAVICCVLAYLAFSHTLDESRLLAGALAVGLAFTFALPVQTAIVPLLVAEHDVRPAMAMNSVSYNAGRTIAPLLCVVVLDGIGPGWVFALNAISFVIFAGVIIAICPAGLAMAGRSNDWTGLRIALWRPRILLMLAMVATVTIADDPVLVLGPTLAHQVLKVSSSWPAFFLSALGLGTALGALLPAKPSTSRRAAIPLLVLAFSVVIFAAGLTPLLSLLAALIAGITALLTGAASQALLLKTAGPYQTVQVMALWAIAWAGSKPLASLADGWLASHYGVFRAGLVLAAPAMAVAGLEIWLPGNRKGSLKKLAKNLAEQHLEPLIATSATAATNTADVSLALNCHSR